MSFPLTSPETRPAALRKSDDLTALCGSIIASIVGQAVSGSLWEDRQEGKQPLGGLFRLYLTVVPFQYRGY